MLMSIYAVCRRKRFKRKALATTETELKAIQGKLEIRIE